MHGDVTRCETVERQIANAVQMRNEHALQRGWTCEDKNAQYNRQLESRTRLGRASASSVTAASDTASISDNDRNSRRVHVSS
jgi:hypothetical protein